MKLGPEAMSNEHATGNTGPGVVKLGPGTADTGPDALNNGLRLCEMGQVR